MGFSHLRAMVLPVALNNSGFVGDPGSSNCDGGGGGDSDIDDGSTTVSEADQTACAARFILRQSEF